MFMFIGELLVGDGNEVVYIDFMLGSKDGLVGVVFVNVLVM